MRASMDSGAPKPRWWSAKFQLADGTITEMKQPAPLAEQAAVGFILALENMMGQLAEREKRPVRWPVEKIVIEPCEEPGMIQPARAIPILGKN